MTRALLAVAFASSVLACASGRAAATRTAPPAVAEPPPPVTPVPETLAFDAGRFGLTMTAEGWTWKVLRRNVTRFDWSGRPAKGDRELLYSFFTEKLDATSARMLPQIAESAAANLTEAEPCRPIEQPPDVVRALGVERIVTVCFEPSTFYGTQHRSGVLHAIVQRGALTIAVVLSNDRAARIPSPAAIGARGSPASR
jgi:hypothetical protein